MKNIPKYAPLLMGGILIIFPVFFACNICYSVINEKENNQPLDYKSKTENNYFMNVLLTIFLSVLFNSRKILKIGMI